MRAAHRMTFAMQELPGEFTTFEFPPGVPAPFNMAAAILGNTRSESSSELKKSTVVIYMNGHCK